ncbi:MAG: restriction endonuclease subunit S [Muricauda sp.]|nr:restriction endonuclease subunit S [uncultured Allomuricauda sp.]MBC72387.1 restriction endonuclease subunit S [Allomuricauda sp.]|tara:strand:- start:9037 stop:10200 length:1164 start_codon:yes stop_codon:yes gene_type:complete
MKKNGQIPELRLKEFNNPWKLELLENIAKRGSGHTPNKKHKNYYNGDIKWVSLADSKYLDDGFINETTYQISEEGIRNSSAVLHDKGSVLLSRDAGIGKSAVMKSKMAVSQHFIVWKPHKDKLDNWFLYYILQIYKPEFERIAIGSTIKTIGLPYFKKLKIKVPELEEQQKIASFLSAVDIKIAQLQRKKELLEEYKKGGMQQIFSRQLRFTKEDGGAYPDWEEKRLGEVAKKESSSISANKIEDNFGNYKIYGATGLIKCIDFYEVGEDYISIVKDGAGVGRTLLCEAESSVLGTLDIIKPKKDVNLYFLYSLLNNLNFTKYITGSTIPHIYFKDYSKARIKIPCIEEQTQISHFLSAIDKKIEVVQSQIKHTQNFKKGLLQQMFV